MVNRAVKYQPIDFVIPVAGASVASGAITVDKNYKTVSGIALLSKDPAKTALSGLSFDKFEINHQEIYPAGFDFEVFAFGDQTNVPARFDTDINEPGENTSVDIIVKDGSIAGQVYPYTAKVILKLTNPVN